MTRRAKAFQVGLAVAAILFLILAVIENRPTFDRALKLDPGRFGAAVVIAVCGFGMLGRSWAVLNPNRAARGALLRRFLVAQPAKYIPGGVAMPVSQVMLARDHDTSTGASLARVAIHSVLMVMVALTLSTALIGLHVVLGVTAGVTGLTLAVLAFVVPPQRIVDFVFRVGRRFTNRFPARPTLQIERRMLMASASWVAGALTSLGIAFVLIAESGIPSSADERMALFGGFELAWAVGFILVPLPAGAGAREAVLALTLGSVAPLGSWIAVSVLHRAALLIAEILTAGWAAATEYRAARTNSRSMSDRTTLS